MSHQIDSYVKPSTSSSSERSAADSAWLSRLRDLLEYKRRHGNAHVPMRHPTLGNWVQRQRKEYRNRSLTVERVRLLDEAGFVWDARAFNFERRVEELKMFRDGLTGVVKVPRREETLYKWCRRARDEYGKRTREGEGGNTWLTEDMIRTLEEAGFVWEKGGGGE